MEVVWESERAGVWTHLDNGRCETARFVEGRYSGFVQGGAPRRVVRIDEVDYKLDFSRMTMKSTVDGSIVPIRRRELSEQPGDPLRALSVYYLCSAFPRELEKAKLTEDALIRDIEPAIVRPLGAKLTCPRDGRLGAAYVDSVCGEDNVGRATHMLSYTWGYKIGAVIDSLAAWCKKRELDPKRVYVWMCVFCINQHRVLEAHAAKKVVPFEEFRKEFESRVCGIGHVLALMGKWQMSLYTTRVWCVFELYTAKRMLDQGQAGFTLEILLSPTEADEFRRTLIEGEGLEPIWRALSNIKVEKAESFSPVDRDRILTLVQNGPGYAKLNKEIIDHLHGWFAESSDGYLNERLAANASDLTTARACSRVAVMLERTSKYRSALDLVRKGKAILETLGAMETDSAAVLLRVEGNALRRLGELAEAQKCYQQAKRIHDMLSLQILSEKATLLQDIGRLEGDYCNLDNELKCHQEACQIRSQDGTMVTPEGASLFRSLGMVYFQKYNYTSALEFFRKAEALHKQTDSLMTPEGAAVLESIGNVMSAMYPPQWTDALTMHEQAHQISSELGIGDSPKGIAQLRRVAYLHERLGAKDKAAAMLSLAKAKGAKMKEDARARASATAAEVVMPKEVVSIPSNTIGAPSVKADPLPWAEADADWGVYYELVDSEPHKNVESRGFPHSLCSFETKATMCVLPEHLTMSWANVDELTTKGREWTLEADALRASRSFENPWGPDADIKIVGYLSPMHEVNLPDETKEKVGIPKAAKHFMFSYPVDIICDGAVKHVPPSTDPDVAFLGTGGYVYLNADKNKFIHINAILPSESGGLAFGPPLKWEPKWTNRLIHAGRFRPVTVDTIRSAGATYFCWIRPNEVMWFGTAGGGAPICPYGGFAYIRRDASAGRRNGPSLKRPRIGHSS